jgi:hypothetical protein
MIGLIFDVVGAFFVAVEAIKLDNFRRFREIVLEKAHRYMLSPRIILVDKKGNEFNKLDGDPLPSERIPGLFMALHNIAGFIVLVILNAFLDGIIFERFISYCFWFINKPWYIMIIVFVVFVIFGLAAGLWVIGELVHVLLENTITISIKLFNVIEEKTPTGTIGIMGFIFLMAGFSLQFYGAYLSGITQ